MSSTSISTRDRILEATWHLMEARQGQGVRIEEIAHAAHVSRQAVYLHFGSRSELLNATARYVDETLGFYERIQKACYAGGGVTSLDNYVEVWGNYIPEIYGLAKALLALRDTDEAAAALWEDRMSALHSGNRLIIERLAQEGMLALAWAIDEATDFFWASISIQTWENLVVKRGWTQDKYVRYIQLALKRALLKSSPRSDI
jgi:AcrR family transcriptional regulator